MVSSTPRINGPNDVYLLVDGVDRREVSGLIRDLATPYRPKKGAKSVCIASN